MEFNELYCNLLDHYCGEMIHIKISENCSILGYLMAGDGNFDFKIEDDFVHLQFNTEDIVKIGFKSIVLK